MRFRMYVEVKLGHGQTIVFEKLMNSNRPITLILPKRGVRLVKVTRTRRKSGFICRQHCMVLMEDTLVWPGTQTLMFLQQLEKPQEDSQQQLLEALPPTPGQRSMVNPTQPVPHQQALLQLRPPLYQSLLRHPTIPLFQPPLRPS